MTLTIPLWLPATALWLAACGYWLHKDPGPYGMAGLGHLLAVAAATVAYLLFWIVTLAL